MQELKQLETPEEKQIVDYEYYRQMKLKLSCFYVILEIM